MSSRKSERLINLTIALLATKRYLTRDEIFRTIEGYEGNPEAKERMFERDKDDLRALGISIEVGELDAFFSDETGYRIRPESYALDLGNLTGVDIAVLSLATEVWRDATFNQPAQSARLKLASLGIASDFESIPAMAPRIAIDTPNFALVATAIATGSQIRFDYIASDITLQERHMDPYGLSNRFGAWYVVGFDVDKGAIRTFRLDRIHGQVSTNKEVETFSIPEDFHVATFLDANLFHDKEFAILQIRKEKGRQLRTRAVKIVPGEEFDLCTVAYTNERTFLDLLLWHGEDVIVTEPAHLRSTAIILLEQLVLLHG